MYFYMTGVDHQPFVIGRVNQPFEQFFPGSLVPPTTEAAMGVFPATVIGRQVTPWGAGTENPEHGIDECPVVPGDATPDTLPAGQVRFQERPDVIRYIVAAMGGNHGMSVGWRLRTPQS